MKYDDVEVYSLCLIPTEKCNLNCSYCMVDKSSGRDMTWETAKAQIDEMMHVPHSFSYYDISFMGGEPFLAFGLIKDIVEYVRRDYADKPVQFSTVTNGTLVHGEIQDWIKENENWFQVTLSLDGKASCHNANRSNSFEKIDMDFFRSLKHKVINMVVTPFQISSLVENISFLELQGFQVKTYIEEGVRWNKDSISLLGVELKRLMDYYIQRPKNNPTSLLRNSLYLLVEEEAGRPQGCGRHVYDYAVSAEGKRYDCHRCMPYENSKVGALTIPPIYTENLSKALLLDDRCKDCFVNYLCNSCPASNASRKGKGQLAELHCMMHKMLYKAQAYFYLTLLAQCPDHVALMHLPSQKRMEQLKAAKRIIRELDLSHPF